MSTFYLTAKSLEQAQRIAEEYGPDVWYDRRESAADVVFPEEWRVYKVTLTVEEDTDGQP